MVSVRPEQDRLRKEEAQARRRVEALVMRPEAQVRRTVVAEVVLVLGSIAVEVVERTCRL